MAEKRKDSKGRNLKDNESQMPDGRYRFRYTDKQGKRQAVYSWRLVPTDKAPAGKRDGLCLREKEAEIQKDTQDGIDTRKAAQMTLNDMFDLYMSGKCELKQSTRANYLYLFQKYVSEGLGQKKIANIKYSDIKRFYNSLIIEQELKAGTVQIIDNILHPTFTLAVRDGYIRTNPTEGALSEIKKAHGYQQEKRHALTIEEQEAFINFISGSNIYRHWLPLFTFFLGTGCRVGEVIGIRWKDCDFESRTISINHNTIYKQHDGKSEMYITTPKTAAGCRTIPMLDEVRKALLQEKRRQMSEGFSTAEIDGYSGFVFTNGNGYIHNPRTINITLERIRTACNKEETEKAAREHREPLEIRHFSVHNLRHTFCTRFCENETNIKVIQEIMGHGDISTTMNIYAEATESKKKESFANLEGKIKIS